MPAWFDRCGAVPNSLAHLGVHGLATRSVLRDADLKWICTGAILPDLPWIAQRVAHPLLPNALQLDLRLYSTVQATLAGCLLLAAAVSLCTADWRRTFGLLSFNALVHLLLDATENHWGSGVHLFAPLSWRRLAWGLYWPESWVASALSVLGLAFVAWAWRARPGADVPLSFETCARTRLAAALLAAYLLLPLGFLEGPVRAGNLPVAVLGDRAARPGRPVEFDRTPYRHRAAGDVLLLFDGEELTLRGPTPRAPALLSLRGRFVDPQTVEVQELHVHWRGLRDLATYAGLALAAAVWLVDPAWLRTRASRRAASAGRSAGKRR